MRLDALGPTNLLKKALFQKRVLVEAHEAHEAHWNLGAVQNRRCIRDHPEPVALLFLSPARRTEALNGSFKNA